MRRSGATTSPSLTSQQHQSFGGLERAFIVSVPPSFGFNSVLGLDTTGYFCVAVYQWM